MRRPSLQTWRISLGALAFLAMAVAVLLFRNYRSEAYPGMSQEQRSYWEWISSISQDRGRALQEGVDLLYKYPGLHRLYLRLSELCVQEGKQEGCREALSNVRVDTRLTALYRDAALAAMTDRAAARPAYLRIAEDRALDPGLARLLVDEARRVREEAWVSELEARWKARRDVGALFGLGYSAVLRSEWSRAESLLVRVSEIVPDDPQAYRELGRIYYATGRSADLERVLRRGMAGAVRRNDLEQEVVLRGNLGLALLERGALDEAASTFDDALKRSRLIANHKSEGFNLYRLAAVRHRQGRYDEALVLLDSAEVRYAEYAPRQRSEVQVMRGAALRALFRFTDAELVLEQAIADAAASANPATQIQGQIALGQLRLRMGRIEAAREITEQAYRFADEQKQLDGKIAALMILGDVERTSGRYDDATRLYEQGLELARTSHNGARIRELAARLGLTALNIQDTRKAREYFDQMLEQETQSGSVLTSARANLGLGHTYALYGNYQEAIRYYDRALSHLDRADGQSAGDLRVSILIAKAGDLATLGQVGKAEQLLKEAHRLAGYDVAGLYRSEVALSHIAYASGRYREALNLLKKAESRGFRQPSLAWQAAHRKALAHWKLKNDRAAEQAFKSAVGIVESMREGLEGSQERASFVQGKVQVYRDFARFLNERNRSNEAFQYLERARSRSLVDLLYTTQQERKLDERRTTDRAIEMSRRLRAIEAQMLEEDYGTLTFADETASNAARGDRLRLEEDRTRRSLQHAEVELGASDRMYTFRPIGTDTLQAILGRDEAVVSYSSEPLPGGNNRLVAYVVTRTQVRSLALSSSQEALVEPVRFFRDQISRPESASWMPASRRLYRELVQPVLPFLAGIRHLHIVPEGVLHYVPFSALQDDKGRFLVERYTLSIAPSVTTLKLCRDRNPRQWRSMLLVADPDGELPGSRREVQQISAGSPNRRLPLIGNSARLATVEELAGQYDILHFATHGRFISRAPWQSHLELHGADLDVAAIGRLKLDAYLVTLSACETGLSAGVNADVPEGDEWVGLNQAFLAAGTPTVMASLWPISDRVSSHFMTLFYNRLGPQGKAWALADVQRRFLTSASTRHPFYWAAFTIIGDPV